MPSARIIGLGRAGSSFAAALVAVGWNVHGVARGEPVSRAAADVDLVLICTPDAVVETVAHSIEPGSAVVGHVAGSLGLGVLGAHDRRAGIHPLLALPNAEVGADRLLNSGWFAVAGDPIAAEVVVGFGGRSFSVADADRPIYHAAACIAANHVVALMGQTERLAETIGVPLEAYIDLARSSIENVADLGPAHALTGPAARGDTETIRLHLESLPEAERDAYRAMAAEAQRLAEKGS
ncbi:MAG: DUF2520 domain-containing protein [Acidimicrobiales bacterium]